MLIVLSSYSEDGRKAITVRDLFGALEENHRADPRDWDWHDYTVNTLRTVLLILEARTLVISDGGSPALWKLTHLGRRYMDSLGDNEACQRIVQAGYERHLASLDHSHDHASVRGP